eukprot:CAMPEP_0184502212 /NCGR_PEP_ID=MMETSP0113_2-20130426/49641_1 /TAXON_ID=91329 /ORGANISM="Norrisiella sphaerica, Strain BC52" /LENGTH=536 /DNA_ID=CAMNT_0026891271 /DNA_START=111 /DNA_END=1721 /DNA_ORIENTATION=+
MNGEHFDDILKDTPNELRPGGLVLFFRSQDSKCAAEYEKFGYQNAAETELPARERAFIAKYDMDLHDKRLNTEFSPEQDLPKRLGISECPTLVYIPQKCDGHTKWCTEEVGDGMEMVGCENFQEQCSDWTVWDGEGDWKAWAKQMIESEEWPALDEVFSSYAQQGNWIKSRDRVTTNTHMRNNFLATALPTFSSTGTKLIKIPDKLLEELKGFYFKHVAERSNEPWDIHGATQLNFHERGTDLVYLDLDPYFRDRVANQYLRPILEEWSGQKLRLNAFYGMREYFPGAWLRNHIDRIDTHVISATLSVMKLNSTKPWPLETVTWTGKRMRFEHKEGEMLLYESATRPHGRPYRMEDGIHVGCFVHFSPTNESTFKDHMSSGRRSMASQIMQVRYRSTPSTGPPEGKVKRVDVIVTPENMDKKNQDQRRRVRRASQARTTRQPKVQDGSLAVSFINDLDKPLILYWVDFEGKPVRNAYLDARDKVTIQTFVGHSFFFAWQSSENPDPDNYDKATMSMGKSAYKASEYLGGKKLHTGL